MGGNDNIREKGELFRSFLLVDIASLFCGVVSVMTFLRVLLPDHTIEDLLVKLSMKLFSSVLYISLALFLMVMAVYVTLTAMTGDDGPTFEWIILSLSLFLFWMVAIKPFRNILGTIRFPTDDTYGF